MGDRGGGGGYGYQPRGLEYLPGGASQVENRTGQWSLRSALKVSAKGYAVEYDCLTPTDNFFVDLLPQHKCDDIAQASCRKLRY